MLDPIAGKCVLDLGCGDGALALELARRGAIVTGLDADGAMIAAARERSALASMPMTLVVGEAENLPFEDDAFDRVVAVTLLCLVDDGRKAIAEMARVLRPGGRLVIGELGYWSLWAAQRRIRGWLGDPIWRTTKFWTARELCDFARTAGLVGVTMRGAIHYPPFSLAARLFAPFDLYIGRHMTFGSAFLALSATKPPQIAAPRARQETHR
jgi:SAM-dependent methyltransferase